MTVEELQQANILQRNIKEIEGIIGYWEQFTGFADEKVNGKESYLEPAEGSVNVLKSYNLNYWQKQLERLQREFDAL
jgi:hypothetical protein